MAAKKGNKRKSPPSRATATHSRHWVGWAVVVGLVILVFALPVVRWWIERDESNLVARGLEVMEDSGCEGCHRAGDGAWTWRADARSPVSLEIVRDAILSGRQRTGSFAASMPAYLGRLEHRDWLGAQQAVGALAGLVGIPEDQELAAGHDVARDMGCFSCHGPLGAGGLANPGSLSGMVPGWYGASFRRTAGRDGGVAAVIRSGSRPSRVPVPGLKGPVLEMPAFESRMDSTELDLLVGYLQWLHDNPPGE